ncbi:unnamed protein product [Prunus armeniaca]
MSSSKSRAQSTCVPVPPDYITGTGIDNHAIEVTSKLHPFAQKNLDENVLHLFENTLVLGPHWFGHVPPKMAELMKKDAEAPLCFESTSALASHSWVSKNLSRSFPSSEVRNSLVKWVDWIDRLLTRYGPHWKRAGIYDVILMSKQSVNRDENLLAAALCFWNSARNTFDFRIGPVAPTLPNRSSVVLLEYRHLAEALHNHIDIGLGPTVLAHLFKNLHTATLENQLNLSAPGAFWMIQIWLQVNFCITPTFVQGSLAAHSLFHSNPIGAAIGLLLGGTWMTWRCIRMPGSISKSACFQYCTGSAFLWLGWLGRSYMRGDSQVYDPSLTQNVGGQSAQARESFLLERKKKKKIKQNRLPLRPLLLSEGKERKLLNVQLQVLLLLLLSQKGLERGRWWNMWLQKELQAAPNATSDTDEELREAFEAVEQEKELEELEEVGEGPQEKAKTMEEEEIPAEVIAESIALAQKQQEDTRAWLTSLGLALFEDPEVEHSIAVPAAEEQIGQSVSEPVDQAVGVPEAGAEVDAFAPEVMVEVPKSVGSLLVVTSPLKPPIVAMPIHSLLGSSATASFADPELAEFEAMDLDAQLDRLEMLSSPVGKAKSKAVKEAMERLKIWQSNELELDEDREAIDQLMKDLDLLHRHNMSPKPILEMSLGLARDVLNPHDHYEDFKPTFKTSEFCKATHEANLADFAK